MKTLLWPICLAVSGLLAAAESALPAEMKSRLMPVILVANPRPGESEKGRIGDAPAEQTIQAVVDPRRPPYQIRITGTAEGNLGNKVERVEIIRTGEYPRRIQTIRPDVDHSESPCWGAEYFTVADIDGDGYQDLQILIWHGATGNSGFEIWLYDPKAEIFVLRKDLEGYEWNHEPGQIRSHFHAGGGEQGWHTAIFEDGLPVVLCGEQTTIPRDPHLRTLAGSLAKAKPGAEGEAVENPVFVFSRTNYDRKTKTKVTQDYLDDGYGQGSEPDRKNLLRETLRKWDLEKQAFVETVYERKDGEMKLIGHKTIGKVAVLLKQ